MTLTGGTEETLLLISLYFSGKMGGGGEAKALPGPLLRRPSSATVGHGMKGLNNTSLLTTTSEKTLILSSLIVLYIHTSDFNKVCK